MRMLLLAGLMVPMAFGAGPTVAKTDGFVPFYWEEGQGKLWLEPGGWGKEFLYVTSLPAGVGSNDIGLDRGMLGRTQVVRWERMGNKVMLVASNYRYRAVSEDEAERRAVKESFAEGVIWGFEASLQPDGRLLVDATSFLLRDAVNAAETLQRGRQGTYRVEASRSAIYPARTKNFPLNTEIER